MSDARSQELAAMYALPNKANKVRYNSFLSDLAVAADDAGLLVESDISADEAESKTERQRRKKDFALIKVQLRDSLVEVIERLGRSALSSLT